MEDVSSQQDAEAGALVAIFPDVFEVERAGTWRVSAPNGFTMTMYVPATYPSQDPPALVFDCANVPRSAIAALSTRLQGMFEKLEIALVWCEEFLSFARDWEASREAGKMEQQQGNSPGDAPEAPSDVHIYHGDPLTDRKSTFQAHAARVKTMKEIAFVIDSLRCDRKGATATHRMVAWRLWDTQRNVQMHDNDDDGEHGAGSRLSQLLERMKAVDVCIVVSRWYGGVHLGPDRFKHILRVARSLLLECNLVDERPQK